MSAMFDQNYNWPDAIKTGGCGSPVFVGTFDRVVETTPDQWHVDDGGHLHSTHIEPPAGGLRGLWVVAAGVVALLAIGAALRRRAGR